MSDIPESGKKTRGHEHLLTLDAPIEAVWKAITDPQELTNWFPLQAEVEPGEGGKIVYSWGDDVGGTHAIHAWEPHHHLRTSWMGGASGADVSEVVVDWRLESDGGKTLLRLVHSGFGRDADWDTEFEGTRRGWAYELGSLKQYLEHHAGTRRRAFWVRQATTLDGQQVWRRLTRSPDLVGDGRLDTLGPGDDLVVELAGEPLSGSVIRVQAPRELSARVDSLNNGRMRLGFEDCGHGPEAHIMLATWGLPDERMDALEASWGEALSRAFG